MQDLTPLFTRRSVSLKDMTGPAPTQAELELILRAATRVPDHGKLCPWRIVVLREQGQRALGAVAAARLAALNPELAEKHLQAERERFARAPVCLAVVSTPKADSKPVWEQQLSAGAVCMNMLHAVHQLGLAGKWLSEWVAYDPIILEALGGHAGDDQIAGFIYIGSKTHEPEDRERPELDRVVEWR